MKGKNMINPSFACLITIMIMIRTGRVEGGDCAFPGLFVFGDSLSDTGQFSIAFPPLNSPYGQTFFHMPAGRMSDGRNMADFFALSLGLPYLDAYFLSGGANFRHGVNFAVSAATALPPFSVVVNPISLQVQFDQFKIFKAQAIDHYAQGDGANYLPSPYILNKALYIVHIGSNDIVENLFVNKPISEVQSQIIPAVIDTIIETIQALYKEGARTMLVFNLYPIGCNLYVRYALPYNNKDVDENGCITIYNDLAIVFNDLMREKLEQLRSGDDLHGAMLIELDYNTIVYDVFANASKYGFAYTDVPCCGIVEDSKIVVRCAQTGYVNGSLVTGGSCPDPSIYVSWDAIHFTEAAYRTLMNMIRTENYFYPSFPLSQLCQLEPI